MPRPGACRRSSSGAPRAATLRTTASARPGFSSTRPTAASGGWICSSAGSGRRSRCARTSGCSRSCPRTTRRCRPPAVSAFSPRSLAGYLEAQTRVEDIGITAGLRYDQFDSRTTSVAESRGARRSVSPRFAVSTVLKGATVVASYGRFTQAPDYQFLVDAAFDDTTRTGRFRRGNADLGYERATQYEISVRYRPKEAISLRVGVYQKRLDGLIASVPLGVNPDSTIFGNADAGTTRGLEVLAERELRNGYGLPGRIHPAGCQGHVHRSVPAQPPDRRRRADGRHDPARAGRVPARLRPAAHAHGHRARQGAWRGRAQDPRRATHWRARGRGHHSRALGPPVLELRYLEEGFTRGPAERLAAAGVLDHRPAGAASAPAGGNHGWDLLRRAQPAESPERGGGAAGYRRAGGRQRRNRRRWRN